jgi:hypothetical protein
MFQRQIEKQFHQSICEYHPFKQNLMLRQWEIYDHNARPVIDFDKARGNRLYYTDLCKKRSDCIFGKPAQ